MPLGVEKRKEIEQVFRKFLLNRIKTVRRLKMRDLDINPFLIRILSHELGLSNSEAIVKWLISQRLERGTVTSFGIALQNAAKVFSEGTGVEGADVLKTKKGRHHHIQVKSGPNTIPKDLGVRIAQLLRSAQRRNRGSLALYGMCYGNKARVSSIVRKYVQEEGGVDWISAREPLFFHPKQVGGGYIMGNRLYELCWQVETDAHSFCYREFKVFRSDMEAREYGKNREAELNDGLPAEERAQDGFCYKYLCAHQLKDIDGFTIELKAFGG